MIRPEPGDDARPTPLTGETSPWDTYAATTPAHGVPLVPQVDDRPTQAIPVAGAYAGQYDRTMIQPVAEPIVPVAGVYAAEPHTMVAAPVATETVYLAPPGNRPPWAAIAAVIALLVGGLAGFLIGHSSTKSERSLSATNTVGTNDPATAEAADQRVNDIFTLLATQARQPSGIQTPTPYPALDELLGTLSAGTASPDTAGPDTAASDPTSSITAERDQLAAQVTDLQEQLNESQAALAAAQQTASTDGTSADVQAQLDEQAQQIASLQKDLDTAHTDLQTVQSQLATANKTISDLDPKPVDDYVGTDITKLRSTAKANGWNLVERPVESASATTGTVTSQLPAAGSTMIKGSVLEVEVAAPQGSTG